MRTHLLTTESIRPVNPNIDLTAERLGLSPVMTKTDPQVTPPSQEPVNASIDVTGGRLSVTSEHHVHDNDIVRTGHTTNRTTVPISIVFDRFRSLSRPKIRLATASNGSKPRLFVFESYNLCH
ncbi:hypothetical protein Tco_0027819 [Tanacetum coccineum]